MNGALNSVGLGSRLVALARSPRGDGAVVTTISRLTRRRASTRSRRWTTVACASIAVVSSVAAGEMTTASAAVAHHGAAPATRHPSPRSFLYPVGTPDVTQPSGMAPPGANALIGYDETYVTGFSSGVLPTNWEVFLGAPAGDPGAQWASPHVTVGNGLLNLSAWQDPSFNNEWVTGGLCQCGAPRTYGAYFVRSRLTGPGTTMVVLLWPVSGWPPEIDFAETFGDTGSAMATVHYTSANNMIHIPISIDVTQWHTWGVIWTPTAITYTVDGRMWGQVTRPDAIPHQPMTLNIQQQTWCADGWACPTTPQQLQVNWVAEYSPSAQSSSVVRPFANRSSTLTPALKAQVTQMAKAISANGERQVMLVGYGDVAPTTSSRVGVLGLRRAAAVKAYLAARLAALGAKGVNITTTDNAAVTVTALLPQTANEARRVVALYSR